MKVLVTGGAGYLGSVVASQLVEAGHEALLTGASFGGCAIALVLSSGEVDELSEATLRTFAENGYEGPVFYEFLPAAGAERVAH